MFAATDESAIAQAIRLSGGIAELVRKMNRRAESSGGANVTRYQVYRWRREGMIPADPADYLLGVEAISGVPRERLRPDLYV